VRLPPLVDRRPPPTGNLLDAQPRSIDDGHMKWFWWVVIAVRLLAFAYAVIGVTGFLRLPYDPG